MADYYSEYSFTIPLSDEREVRWMTGFVEKADLWTEYGCLGDVEICDDEAWFHDHQGAYLDDLAILLQRFLRRFHPNEAIRIQWANTCSKPRLDAFGGGAAVVTADSIYNFDTSDFFGEIARVQVLSFLS